MNKKFLFFLLFFLFSFSVNSILITAPGIAGPVLERIFFQPGLEKTYLYHVNSNTVRAMDHLIEVSGDLTPYFTLSTDILYLEPNEIKPFTVHMKLPGELEPGEHRAYICVTETEGRSPPGMPGVGIGTKVRICGVITVISPYPGKNINFSIKVENVAKGENVTFKLDIFNTGTETVDVNGVIDVFSQNPEAGKETKLITLKTDSETLVSGEKVILKTTYNTSDMDIGEYKAKATVHYDGLKKTKEETFRIGELDVEVVDFTHEVVQNQLSPINIEIKSKWNGQIKDVYASLEVMHPEKNLVIATINSPPTDLRPWEEKKLVAYWDTTGVGVGEYNAKVTLHYENKISIKEGKIKVKEFIIGPTISLTTILLFILILVVLLLIVLIIMMMRKRQKPRKRVKKRK